MISNNTLKEYYVKLQELYNNSVNMLTAINQSLTSSSPEVSVTMLDTNNNTSSTYRLPSFLYLESKLEQLNTNFENLFNMPNSGEAWFDNSGSMLKLNMIRSNTAPIKPICTPEEAIQITPNNALKDLVTPKMYMKLNISNLPDNIEKIYMRKLIVFDNDLFNALKENSDAGYKKYTDYEEYLYNYTKGSQYDYYDSVLDLPIKSDVYDSSFRILSIINSDTYDDSQSLEYIIQLDNLEYYNKEDYSVKYNLKVGDYISLNNSFCVYKITDIDKTTYEVTIREWIGHQNLTSYEENSSMEFSIYTENYDDYHYVQIPLEENPYIVVFIGTIFNGVRSLLGDGQILDLNNIQVINEAGNKIVDDNNNPYSYIEYYNKFCINIGDLIMGLSETAYSQISNYNIGQLSELTSEEDTSIIKEYVDGTINTTTILSVVNINDHINGNSSADSILNLNSQKTQISSELTTNQNNIDDIYNSLLTTDFSQDTSVTQLSLKSELNDYYSKRKTLQTQLNSIINEIESLGSTITDAKPKYRIRGISNTTELDNYLTSTFGNKCQVVGMDCEYLYKTPGKDTTSLMSINNNVFTNWNKLKNIDKQRKIVVNSSQTGYEIKFEDYSSTQNIIKWNQIDIPIQSGEQVDIRIRYKYSIGQPFIDIYTPWSTVMTMNFPVELEENVEVSDVIDNNAKDIVSAKFNETLISEGYQEHISNALNVNNQKFYHMPENIYSGFNTAENNMISLKDKLVTITNDMDQYKSTIDYLINAKFDVYIHYDNNEIELNNNTINKINIFNNDYIYGKFIRKEINLIIKNTGTTTLKLYSLFPGNVDMPLIYSDKEYFNKYIKNYERLPISVSDIPQCQVLNQWIYFRTTNPYNNSDYIYNKKSQQSSDMEALTDGDKYCLFNAEPQAYMKKPLIAPLVYRNRNAGNVIKYHQTFWGHWNITKQNKQDIKYYNNDNDYESESFDDLYDEKYYNYVNDNKDFFRYGNTDNKWLMKYENIQGMDKNGNVVTLDEKMDVDTFIQNYSPDNFEKSNDFVGAFLYPNLESISQLTINDENKYLTIGVGKTISIPLIFEYFLNNANEEDKQISKYLSFDICNSQMTDPINYIVKFTANYDSSASTSVLQNIYNTSLTDEVSE